MMKLLLFIMIIPFLSFCAHDNKSGTDKKTLTQKTNTELQKVEGTSQMIDSLPSIVIQDSSDYSTTFIKSLKPDKTFWKYYLNENLFIINNQDTSGFPPDPPIGKEVVLSNKKGSLEIRLTAVRILLSSIEYKIEFIDNGIPTLIKTGIADLSPHFFLGSESDTDDASGYSYFCAEYWDKNIGYLSIRIGKEPVNKITHLGKIIGSLGSYKIDLDNFPTLIEK